MDNKLRNRTQSQIYKLDLPPVLSGTHELCCAALFRATTFVQAARKMIYGDGTREWVMRERHAMPDLVRAADRAVRRRHGTFVRARLCHHIVAPPVPGTAADSAHDAAVQVASLVNRTLFSKRAWTSLRAALLSMPELYADQIAACMRQEAVAIASNESTGTWWKPQMIVKAFDVEKPTLFKWINQQRRYNNARAVRGEGRGTEVNLVIYAGYRLQLATRDDQREVA